MKLSRSMGAYVKRMEVEEAVQDIKNRTLAAIPGDVGRLICIASTRDYNTGKYYHDGLTSRFSEEVAGAALAACHLQIFQELALSCSLEELVQQLERHVLSSHVRAMEVIEAWEELEPYRVIIPLGCDPLFAKIFFSNFKTALAILRSRFGHGPQDPRSS